MSSESSSGSEHVPDVETVPDRDVILSQLAEGMRECHEKAVNGRVYDTENEKVRQGWFRSLGYLASQYRQVMRDKEIEELHERMEELEERLGDGEDR